MPLHAATRTVTANTQPSRLQAPTTQPPAPLRLPYTFLSKELALHVLGDFLQKKLQGFFKVLQDRVSSRPRTCFSGGTLHLQAVPRQQQDMNLPPVLHYCTPSAKHGNFQALSCHKDRKKEKKKKFSSRETASYSSRFQMAFGEILINFCLGYHLKISGASWRALPLLLMSGCNNPSTLTQRRGWARGTAGKAFVRSEEGPGDEPAASTAAWAEERGGFRGAVSYPFTSLQGCVLLLGQEVISICKREAGSLPSALGLRAELPSSP